MLLCASCKNKEKQENGIDQDTNNIYTSMSEISDNFIDEEYRYDVYNDDLDLMLSLNESCVYGTIMYDKTDKKIYLSELSVDET